MTKCVLKSIKLKKETTNGEMLFLRHLITEISVPPKMIYRFNTIHIEIPKMLYKYGQIILKCI
jgi:hypothetical protein